MIFSPFSRSNPCPVCEKASSDCRYNKDDETFILCHTYVDAQLKEHVNGYSCVKTSNGHTACFKPDNRQEWLLMNSDLTNEQRAAKEAERARLKKEQEKARKEKISAEMSAVDRDYWFTQLIEELTLNDADYQHLSTVRGFTDEQIRALGYRSIPAGYKPISPIPSNFPGMRRNGSLNNAEGILLPIRNVDGLIVTANIHVKNCKDGGKYRKLSCENSSEHILGEIAVGCQFPDIRTNDIYLVEGGGYKATLASLKHGIVTISPNAGYLSSSPINAEYTLNKAKQKYGSLRVVIVPDAGDINNLIVMTKWRKQYDYLSEQGYSVVFAWWGQKTKEQDDIDELDTIADISYISAEKFFALQPKVEVPIVLDNTEPILSVTSVIVDVAEAGNWAFKQWIRTQRYTPNKRVSQPEFTLLALNNLPQHNAIWCIKSGLGTGKTKAILEWLKKDGRTSTWLGYINNLLLQICARAKDIDILLYHLQTDDSHNLVMDAYSHQAACIPSLPHLDGFFDNKVLVIDEACSVLLAAVDGGILGSEQGKILAMFARACQDADLLICADANMSDIYANFIHSLTPNKELVKIENTHLAREKHFTFVDCIEANEDDPEDMDGKIKGNDITGLVKMMQSTAKLFFTSDSRRLVKTLNEIFTTDGKRSYALHRDSAGEAWAKDFLENPDDFIKGANPEVIGMSPTGSSGISITTQNYFEACFHIFYGVLSTNQQVQIMNRVRDNTIMNFVYCPQKSRIRNRNQPGNYTINGLNKALQEREALTAALTAEGMQEYLIQAKARLDPRWENFSAQLQVIDNYEQDNLRKCLTWKLESMGYKHHNELALADADTKEEIKGAKEVILDREATELFTVEEFETTLEADKAVKKNDTPLNQKRREKTYLIDSIPGIKELPQWSQDFIKECHLRDSRYISSIQKNWMLDHLDISQQRHDNKIFTESTKEHPVGRKLSKSDHLQINALSQLNIQRLFDKEFHKDTLEVVAITEAIRSDKKLQTGLNITIPKKATENEDRLKIISSVLAIIGKKTKSTGQKLSNGVKLRHYVVLDIDHQIIMQEGEPILTRQAVYECLTRKWDMWVEKQNEKADKQRWENEQADKRVKEQEEKLHAEWNKAKENIETAEFLTPENVADTAHLLTITDDANMYQGLVSIIPSFALKAAMSTLDEAESQRLVLLGAEAVPLGAYEVWRF